MKIATRKNIVRNQGFSEEITFRVEAEAETFNAMIDIYSNPIEAIVRELSTNAYESHTDNGNPEVQFDVEMPTKMNLIYSVRDYGTGMSREKVVDTYTVMSASDKRNTNDMDGCFGQGSKAPFTYAKAFTVESYVDGKKYMYTMHFNTKGVPTASAVPPVDTDEPNGVKVSIPVGRHDVELFKSAANRVYPFFKNIPKIKKHVLSELITLEDNESFTIVSNKCSVPVTHSSFAQMGNVLYPINQDLLSDTDRYGYRSKDVFPGLKQNHLPDDLTSLLKNGLILKFDVGDLQISRSRETLIYQDRTKNKIKEKIEKYKEYIIKEVEAGIANASSLYEVRNVLASNKYDSSVTNTIASGLVWKGQPVFNDICRFTYGNLRVDLSNTDLLNMLQSYDKGYNAKIAKKRSVNFFDIDEDTKIYEYEKMGDYKKCELLYDSGVRDFYVIRFTKEQADLRKELVRIIDKDILIPCSTLPAPEKIAKTYVKVGVFEYHPPRKDGWGHLNSDFKYVWKKSELEIGKDRVFYVELSNYMCTYNGKEVGSGLVDKGIKLLNKMGYNTGTVYGIRKGAINKFKDNPLCVNLFDYAKKKIGLNTVAHSFFDKVNREYTSIGIPRDTKSAVRNFEGIVPCGIEKDFKEMTRKFYLYDKNSMPGYITDYNRFLMYMYGSENCLKASVKDNSKIDNMINEYKEKYPLVYMFASRDLYLNSTEREDFNRYIETLKEN